MKRIFKNYLVPHEGNDYKPHVLRGKSAAWLAGIAALIYVVSLLYYPLVLSRTSFTAAVLPGVLIDLSNERRAEAKVPALTVNPLLRQAAQMKANDMVAKGYFAHVSPEGIDPWYWMNTVGYSYWFAGENLAVNFNDSDDVVEAWMESLGHRKNMLDTRFTEIGIATAEGIYNGRRATFVVQMFGRPLPAVAETKAAGSTEEVVSTPAAPPKEEPAPVQVAEETFTETEVELPEEVVAEELEAPLRNPQPMSSYASDIEEFLATPGTAVNYIYGFFILLVSIALAMSIFAEVEKRHLPHILYGFGLLVIMTSAIFINELGLFTTVTIQ